MSNTLVTNASISAALLAALCRGLRGHSLFGGVADMIHAPGTRDFTAGFNKHSRHTVAQDKRAALKARNKLRNKH